MDGFIAPGYDPVAEEFQRTFDEDHDVGGAFSAVVCGELVVDLWGGTARNGEAWERDTLSLLFSGSKGIVAVAMLMLIEEGTLELERPLTSYWPEFGMHGKDWITVADVLTHRAGVPALLTPVSMADAIDSSRMAKLTAETPPFWGRERRPAYHALTFGWLCGELIRRTTDMSVGRFVAERIAEPLELALWLGAPADVTPRVAEVVLDPAGFTVLPVSDPRGEAVFGNPPLFSPPLQWNTPELLCAEIPAVNAVGDARSVARFYASLVGGSEQGLVTATVLTQATTARLRSCDEFNGEPMVYGLGFQLPSARLEYGPVQRAFGHTGAGGSVHGGWPDLAAGFSYSMRQLRDKAADHRGTRVLNALAAVLNARTS